MTPRRFGFALGAAPALLAALGLWGVLGTAPAVAAERVVLQEEFSATW